MVQSKINHNKSGQSHRRGDRSPLHHRRAFGDVAPGGVEEIKSTVSRAIRERPLESVLIAAGLGILCGQFRRSSMAALIFSAGAGLAAGFLLRGKRDAC